MHGPDDDGTLPADEVMSSAPSESRGGSRGSVPVVPDLRKPGARTRRLLRNATTFLISVFLIAFLYWYFFLRPTKLVGRWELSEPSRLPELKFQAVLREDGSGEVTFVDVKKNASERHKFTYRVQGELLEVRFEGWLGLRTYRMEMRENWLGLWPKDRDSRSGPPDFEFYRIGNE
jgi:hypothetical protein